ncbi:NAD(P)/FAD-dependent oxidoreductase [Rubrivivax albus]|uniref:NAD(P)/FAD-dependent oxidoreductase n=1 Tax=Rubrivivax albus TaxID=2499835 RepID=A0A3S2U8H5_9BURK|nr:NAD(P)/FAD-dependent oxidoreductase [Rubrivivax albus]RVT51097.1 NAD(P)/FAD-dependent oxidoreductase [Rubrivivax albus]
METLDTLVIGAGVVGLACARALARQGHEVVVLEAADAIGTGTSARNSEVIHAGLYYDPGSWKARLCVHGRRQLYAYAAERGIPHRRCGKLIVATAAGQESGLEAIRSRGSACGVDDLAWLTGAQARALEPELQCVAALHSPSTGIVDSHALMLALQGEAEDHGAMLAFKSPVERIVCAPAGGFTVHVGGDEPSVVQAHRVVNAAGLHAQTVARRIEGLDAAHVPAQHWARGHYFALAGRPAFQRLIYPLPEPGGLGVHLTLDLAGQMRFGPDVQWVPVTEPGAEDYAVDPARAAGFDDAIRRFWPALPTGRLQPAYAGLRPKVSGPGEPAADFVLSGVADHGWPGLVNLFGIESPGLTAALAIGEQVAQMLQDTDA